jgi:hypothetical protein
MKLVDIDTERFSFTPLQLKVAYQIQFGPNAQCGTLSCDKAEQRAMRKPQRHQGRKGPKLLRCSYKRDNVFVNEA